MFLSNPDYPKPGKPPRNVKEVVGSEGLAGLIGHRNVRM